MQPCLLSGYSKILNQSLEIDNSDNTPHGRQSNPPAPIAAATTPSHLNKPAASGKRERHLEESNGSRRKDGRISHYEIKIRSCGDEVDSNPSVQEPSNSTRSIS